MTAVAPSPTAGILAADGSAMVHALVYHHAVPQVPLEEFADFVEPIRTEEGQVQDWHLSMRKLLAHRDAPVHELWTAFGAWRRSYVKERVVGDLATVHAFLAWADHRTDVSALHVLNLRNARVEAGLTPTVAFQVGEAEAACRAARDTGLGVTTPQRPGLVRGFCLGDEPLLLLADRGTAVSAVRGGLDLVDPTLAGGPEHLLVHGWVVASDGVTAVADEGTVELGTARGGRLLAQLAPGCEHVAVLEVPLLSVFGPLLLALREAATTASADLLPLYVRTGPSAH